MIGKKGRREGEREGGREGATKEREAGEGYGCDLCTTAK